MTNLQQKKKQVIPDRNTCQQYEMFCGRISTVNISSVEIDAPTKPNPIKMYIEDFIQDFELEEGDLVGLHYWVLPNGIRGRAAEVLKANDARRYKKAEQERQQAARYEGSVLKKYNGGSSKGGFTDIFELARNKLEKTS